MFTVTLRTTRRGLSSEQRGFKQQKKGKKIQPVGRRRDEEKSRVHSVSECINLETSVGIVGLCFPQGRYSGIPLKATETLCISNLGVTPRCSRVCVCSCGVCVWRRVCVRRNHNYTGIKEATLSNATNAQKCKNSCNTHTHPLGNTL